MDLWMQVVYFGSGPSHVKEMTMEDGEGKRHKRNKNKDGVSMSWLALVVFSEDRHLNIYPLTHSSYYWEALVPLLLVYF